MMANVRRYSLELFFQPSSEKWKRGDSEHSPSTGGDAWILAFGES